MPFFILSKTSWWVVVTSSHNNSEKYWRDYLIFETIHDYTIVIVFAMMMV